MVKTTPRTHLVLHGRYKLFCSHLRRVLRAGRLAGAAGGATGGGCGLLARVVLNGLGEPAKEEKGERREEEEKL